MVSLGTDGRVSASGTVSEVLADNASLAEKVTEEAAILEKADHQIDPEPVAGEAKAKDGKLMVKEEIAEGHVSLSAGKYSRCGFYGTDTQHGLSVKLYVSGMSGNHPFLFWGSFVAGLFLTELLTTMQTWFLGYWAGQYDTHAPGEVPVK